MLNRGTAPSLWQELQRLQRDMEGVFADVTPAWRWPLTGEYPPINITRDEGAPRRPSCCWPTCRA